MGNRSWAAWLLALAACSTSPRIVSDFEGGHVGEVRRVSDDRFELHLGGQSDQDGRNRQVTWYYFRLDGARDQTVVVDHKQLRGEYNYRPAGIPINGEAPPVVSEDGVTWRHLDVLAFDKETETASMTLRPRTDRLWVAHIQPYTVTRLDRLFRELEPHPHLKRKSFGKTVEGRPLWLVTIGDPAVKADRPVIWLMCRQHAWESGTSYVGEGAIRHLLSDKASELRRRVIFKILPMVDPDGVAAGGVRFNRHGYDLNRNWDSCDPENPEHRRLMPEISAIKHHLQGAQRIDLFLTLHNQERGGWLSGAVHHPGVAERFFKRLKEETICDLRNEEPRKPGKRPDPGRLAVYAYLDRDLRKPAFLLEQGVAHDEKLNRLPTAEDRLRFGRELAGAMAATVLE